MGIGTFQYQGILIDSTFFVRPFPEDLKQLFHSCPVYKSETWKSAVSAMGLLLKDPHKTFFHDNLSFLNGLRFLRPPSRHHDLMDMALGMAAQNSENRRKFLLVTADKLLMQRLVLANVGLDIYDLWEEKILTAADFPALQAQWSFHTPDHAPVPTADTNAETLILYDESGAAITFKKSYKGGREAVMYTSDALPGQFAKIYRQPAAGHTPLLHREKIGNIQRLQDALSDNPSSAWALVPTQKLYLEPERTNVVGFLMRAADYTELLADSDILQDEYDVPDHPLMEAVNVCLNLARQIAFLSVYGFSVYDFNVGNFAIPEDLSDHLLMMDTDSFGSGNYFTDCFAPDLNTRGRFNDGMPKTKALELCVEFACVRIAKCLIHGDHNPLYANGQPLEPSHSYWATIPAGIRRFVQEFLSGSMDYHPHFDALVHLLWEEKERLEQASPDPELSDDPDMDDTPPQPEPRQPEPPRRPTTPVTPRRTASPGSDDPFQPSRRMLIRQTTPSFDTRRQPSAWGVVFTPAPMRTFSHAPDHPSKQELFAYGRRQKQIRKTLKIAGLCCLALLIFWILFSVGADLFRQEWQVLPALRRWTEETLPRAFDQLKDWPARLFTPDPPIS